MSSQTPSSSSSFEQCGSPSSSISEQDTYEAVFEGQIFSLEDGTRWMVLQPLSRVAFDHDCSSPCEGRQVYTCVCLDEPHSELGEFVVKIKFQIPASDCSTRQYKADVWSSKEECKRHPNGKTQRQRLVSAKAALERCTQPTKALNYVTKQEIDALDRLGEKKCASAPWLISFAQGEMGEGMHEDAIVNGYCVFILMTKLPGKPLVYDEFCKMSFEKRELIRNAFQTALLDIWASGVYPCDKALRNVLWDIETHTCFIVDFEDCDLLDMASDSVARIGKEVERWDLGEADVQKYQYLQLEILDSGYTPLPVEILR